MASLISLCLFARLLIIPVSAKCNLPETFPPLSPRQPRLPDPWRLSSTNQTITSIEDFRCRQQEWSKMLQQYELGDLPPPPASVTGSITSNNTALITTVTMPNNRAFSFTSKIELPPSYNPDSQTFPGIPAVIGLGSININITTPLPHARIIFNDDACASQSGASSRVDSLSTLSPSIVKIDTSKIGVTGCSRNGKGVLVIGAFEPRVALTIPQESGPGGSACWRILEAQRDTGGIRIPEDPGDRLPLCYFLNKTFGSHAGMIAPRGLLVIENDIEQINSPVAAAGCMAAAKKIYQGVGVGKNMGYTSVGGHGHCQFSPT
ncbi:4-O-methyl-glucuronoyl methylesterase [Podospora australis]|uniref:(4-O-methyl)-D-glucuronate--lignin esterase n=1 Tax=Podospora australis TaxID=1536484 RepID=A0AAN7AE82_9PEZI|nr:4-O-methyl-glucuronoyl methylesterase [Podospora australis]